MKKISLIHPSRGRSAKSLMNATHWHKQSGLKSEQLEIIISCDLDDQELPNYVDNLYPGEFGLIANENKSVVDATNKAADIAEGDILIYLSDDFLCPENWGEVVLKEFEDERPLIIKVDDCLQPLGIAVLTIPIMNRLLYEKLGYFWYPEYRSMFVDEDLYWTSRRIGALKFSEHLKFPHEHPANGKAPNDDIYIRSSRNWDQGKALFEKRRGAGFPI